MDARKRQAIEWANMMRAAQDGDSAAYNRLLREIAPAIRRIVGNRMPNSADAEDVVQDVLLSVHAVRHTYDP
ncbi:MAG: sigma factor, partial [Pseudomonadota bacterium]